MARAHLADVLTDARRRGFLGPGPVEDHIDHADGFARCAREVPATAVDLGSGGGVPALPLALQWSESSWVLVETQVRRAAFLRQAVATLGLGGRVVVVEDRAETAGREWRRWADLVTARAFGPPAVTAECGAPFLRTGGALLVSEPPGDGSERWPADGLAVLGLAPAWRCEGPAMQALQQQAPCPDRFPRRPGIPEKRPLFGFT